MIVQETLVVLFQALHQVLPAGLNWRESLINNNKLLFSVVTKNFVSLGKKT